MDRVRPLLPFLAVLIVAIGVVAILYPDTDPEGYVALGITDEEAGTIAVTLARNEGVDADALPRHIELRSDRDVARRIHQKYGIAEGNELLRSQLPGYTWRVRLTKKSAVNVSFESQQDQEENIDLVAAWLRGEVRVHMDGRGRLLSYHRTIPDSLALPSVSADSARNIADRFLTDHFGILRELVGIEPADVIIDTTRLPRRIERPARTDYEYSWLFTNSVMGDPVAVKVSIAGSVVSGASAEIEVPESFKENSAAKWMGVVAAVLYSIVIVILAVISFKRFRAYEIGFRTGTIVGVATGVIMGIELFLILSPGAGLELIFPVLLGPLFYGGALILMWSASESSVREVWKDKMVTVDLLVHGHFLHSRIGAALVRGAALGVTAYALILAVLSGAGFLEHVQYFRSEDESYQAFTIISPATYVVTHSFYENTYTTAFFLMFLASWVHKRFGSTSVTIGVPLAVMTIIKVMSFTPFWVSILAVGISMFVVIWAFTRYDLLTAFMSLVVLMASKYTAMLAFSGPETYENSAIGVGVILLASIAGGFALQFRRHEQSDFDAIAPVFAKFITERERLKHELTIARTVQMSFLPKSNPSVPHLEIASRCAPALEVGGDYYDFIDLGDGRLAVVVGDVSGKGTQAAFFMTLTKGFLRAVAKVSHSPATTLTEVNKLFYENVERGVFISLVYGVFDTLNSTLTVARAGHNPVIMRKSYSRDTQVVSPMGLALGLDPGPAFEKSIREETIPFHAGDLFVFNTDGFPEAMNKKKEEYGEERLARSIEQHANKPAPELLEGVFADMRQYVGKAEQHDDLTMVVVKIL
ncbi:MAG: hypothetical protein A3H45_12595 [Ignavibacteria bacterium RIFCSPLOWO2_02_FULL_55_14]|nr:MAG: hypothetical protein A2X68_13245 [Ignavibacteria bacterium GWC2_56_12]OGU70985.1 MAG: hypothetical protein A3H45_12595 [Ignavibacteria bacterium RIFCSPLOWO2_02_FULL_55_14]HAV23598.1 hypothetical protein [Bacteroidota bacterium]